MIDTQVLTSDFQQNLEGIVRLATETDDHLVQLWEYWMSRIKATNRTDIQNQFRIGLLRLAYSYSRLSALSVAFQQSFGRRSDEAPFLKRVRFIIYMTCLVIAHLFKFNRSAYELQPTSSARLSTTLLFPNKVSSTSLSFRS